MTYNIKYNKYKNNRIQIDIEYIYKAFQLERRLSMRKYFGTDGVRGVANTELTCDLAYKLGRAGGYINSLK